MGSPIGNDRSDGGPGKKGDSQERGLPALWRLLERGVLGVSYAWVLRKAGQMAEAGSNGDFPAPGKLASDSL